MKEKRESRVWTIGHSTLPLKDFLRLLKIFNIKTVVDVRRFPTSKKSPHFRSEILEKSLPLHGISYIWMGELLGGYRKGGYEEYTKTENFRKGIEELVEALKRDRVAIMCAEKIWFRCHRRFIADELTRRGVEVIHIVDERRQYAHRKKSQEQA